MCNCQAGRLACGQRIELNRLCHCPLSRRVLPTAMFPGRVPIVGWPGLPGEDICRVSFWSGFPRYTQPRRWVLLLSSAQLVGLWVPKPLSDALYLLLQARYWRNSPHVVFLVVVFLFPDALTSTPGAQSWPGDSAQDADASRCVGRARSLSMEG